MSDLHEHTQKDSSLSTLILLAVILLGIMYFLAKGCTNSDEHEVAPAHHTSVSVTTGSQKWQS
jgi:hypothetical protein